MWSAAVNSFEGRSGLGGIPTVLRSTAAWRAEVMRAIRMSLLSWGAIARSARESIQPLSSLDAGA